MMGESLKTLEVTQASLEQLGDQITLEIGETLRTLPGRRMVSSGRLVEADIQVVAKCYLPHAKQERDWKREWDGLASLQSMGFPVPPPLALCRDDEGNVYVVMRYIEGAVTLGQYLEQATLDDCRHKMEALARLVGELHSAGIRQMDQHVDNWAVAGDSLYVLDAGTYRFTDGSLSDADRWSDLAAICVTLPPIAEQCFRSSLEIDQGASELEMEVLNIQQARARRYYKKTQRTCTEFVKYCEKGNRGVYLRNAEAALIEDFYQRPESMMAQGQRLKSGNTCTVQTLDFDGKAYVLKRYNRKPFLSQFRRSLFLSRACKSWSNGWVLNLAFIPTAKPVAFLDVGVFPRGLSYLLMEQIDGVLLPDYMVRAREDASLMASLIEEVGRIWDSLAPLRAVHGDLKATNWMVDSSGRVYLFDLDSLCFGLSSSAYQRGRKKDMWRFLKNWKSDPQLAEAFRRRMGGVDER